MGPLKSLFCLAASLGAVPVLRAIEGSEAVLGHKGAKLSPAVSAEDFQQAPDKASWTFKEAQAYIQSTKDFEAKPCVVYRDIWDPGWTKKTTQFDAQIIDYLNARDEGQKLPSVGINPMPADDVHALTFHHSEGFVGESIRKIKQFHTGSGKNERNWSDIAYHYLVMAVPDLEKFENVTLPAALESRKNEGMSEKEREKYKEKALADFKKERQVVLGDIEKMKKDPRNKDCVRGGTNWLIYEGRPVRYQGSHAGRVSVRWNESLQAYEPLAWNQAGYYETFPVESAVATVEKSAISDADDEVRPRQVIYKYQPESGGFLLCDLMGNPLVSSKGLLNFVELIEPSPFIKRVDGKPVLQKLTEPTTLGFNAGKIGLMISGTYSPLSLTTPHGYDPTGPESQMQPPKEVAMAVGQMIHSLKSQFELREMRAHRSGEACEKHNITGGECPGEGCLPMLESYIERFSLQGGPPAPEPGKKESER